MNKANGATEIILPGPQRQFCRRAGSRHLCVWSEPTMVLDPARGFCLCFKVPREAWILMRPGHLDAPTVPAFNGLQLRHGKRPHSAGMLEQPLLRLSDFSAPLAASVGYTTCHILEPMPNKQQTNIKQKTNRQAQFLTWREPQWDQLAWGVRHE